jgi:hypothetical protein
MLQFEEINAAIKEAKSSKYPKPLEVYITEDSKCPACSTRIKTIHFDGKSFHYACTCGYDSSLYKIYPFNEVHQYNLNKEVI